VRCEIRDEQHPTGYRPIIDLAETPRKSRLTFQAGLTTRNLSQLVKSAAKKPCAAALHRRKPRTHSRCCRAREDNQSSPADDKKDDANLVPR